jgi:hypothetical protein
MSLFKFTGTTKAHLIADSMHFKTQGGLVTFEGLQLFREPRVTLRLPRRPARGFIKDKDSDAAAPPERNGRASVRTCETYFTLCRQQPRRKETVRNMRDILHFVLQKPRSLNKHIPITPCNSEFGTCLKASIYQADLPAILLLPTSHMHDIECGLLLKASAVDFEYNGVRHQKGSLRVIKVEQDGVCKVWLFGICPVRQQLMPH